MRHPLFRFGSSVKLAVVLLSVIILASIAGTIYETSFDARVARAYIYNAWWFNLWLTILCLNLTCSAFSRWPWQRRHTGFLLTHLGIIVLLIGAMIGRRWGIEGTLTLHRGESPDNRLEIVDDNVLRVEDGGDRADVQQFPVEIIGRHPSPTRPWALGKTAGGWDIALVDYAPALTAEFEPQAVADVPGAGRPAARVRLTSKRLKRSIEEWLLVGDTDHGAIDLQLAAVTLLAGEAPAVAPEVTSATGATTRESVDERIFSLALHPDEGKHLPAPGTVPSGVTVKLKMSDGKPTVLVGWQGATWNYDPVADRAKPDDLGDSGLTVVVEDYWPDLVVKDGEQLATASDRPDNPAVLVRVHGHLPTAESGAPVDRPPPAAGAAPEIGGSADNAATIYCDAAGKLTFNLRSSALPKPIRGDLPLGKPINTGWADWQIEAVRVLPAAISHTEFRPAPAANPATGDQAATSGDPERVRDGAGDNPAGDSMAGAMPGDNRAGVRVRLTRAGTTLEQWAPIGWEFTLPATPGPLRLAYGPRVEALPIGLQLDHFDVTFNEGTDNPASFRSDLRVTDVEGETGTGSCSMNHPYNFPSKWWNTFSGQTYKMSQASWNPKNRDESVIQILRDPGWLLKWIGSLLVCSGIFTLFYLRPGAPRNSAGKATAA